MLFLGLKWSSASWVIVVRSEIDHVSVDRSLSLQAHSGYMISGEKFDCLAIVLVLINVSLYTVLPICCVGFTNLMFISCWLGTVWASHMDFSSVRLHVRGPNSTQSLGNFTFSKVSISSGAYLFLGHHLVVILFNTHSIFGGQLLMAILRCAIYCLGLIGLGLWSKPEISNILSFSDWFTLNSFDSPQCMFPKC